MATGKSGNLINSMQKLIFTLTIYSFRLEGIQNISTIIQELETSSIPTQALVKVINRKPGLKDTNFQVLNARLDVVKYLAENCSFTMLVCLPAFVLI